MKKSLFIVAAVVISTMISFAQGTIGFANNSSTQLRLPSGEGLPVGSTFRVELMYAHDGTPDAAFDLIAVRVGAPVGIGPAPGLFNGGFRTAPTPTPGGYGLFQVRAWEVAFGSSYQEAVAAPSVNGQYALVGKSAIIRVLTGDPTPQNPPSEPGSLVGSGFQGFTLRPVPEPSATVFVVASVLSVTGWHILRRSK